MLDEKCRSATIVKMSPKVSIIVLNFKSPRDTITCTKALLNQTVSDIEVLVVDNHSDDDSVGILRNGLEGLDRVRIIETLKNLGYGKGNNFGATYATGEFIMIINPDNTLEPTGLERLVKAMEEDPSIGLIAPKLQFPDGSVRDSFRPFPSFFEMAVLRVIYRKKYQNMKPAVPTAPIETDWIHGACFLMRTSLYKELKGFDDRFFLFFEDVDICRRIWKSGKRVIFDPTIVALDKKQRLSSGGIISFFTKWTVREHVKSVLRYFLKWGFFSPQTRI